MMCSVCLSVMGVSASSSETKSKTETKTKTKTETETETQYFSCQIFFYTKNIILFHWEYFLNTKHHFFLPLGILEPTTD